MSLVTKLRQQFGLKDREISVLRAHLSVLPSGPLDPSKMNISFMCLTEAQERAAGMDERRFRRAEASLEEAGLIHRRLSGNGRRYPVRNAAGEIIDAYGIDLAPLLQSHGKLLEMLSRVEEERLALRAMKNAISARLSAVIRTFESCGAALPSCVEDLRIRRRSLFRRVGITLQELKAFNADLQEAEALDTHASLVATESDLADPKPHQTSSTEHDIAADSAIESPAAPVTSRPSWTDKKALDAGQSVRRIESKPKEKNKTRPQTPGGGCLRSLWRSLQAIPDFFPSPPTNDHEAFKVLFEFSSFLGLGQQVVTRALTLLGLRDCIAAMDYMARNIEKIAKPQGYLMSMVKCYESGRPIANGLILPPGGPS